MSQIFKRPNRSFYYARWQFQGKDFVRSTGKTKRAEALKELDRFVRECKDEDTLEQVGDRFLELLNRAPSEDQQRLRTEWIRRIELGQQVKLATDEAWDAWRENPNREYDPKPSTITGYRAIWKRFKAWADHKGLTHLHQVQPENAEAYAAHLWKSGVSPSTFNAHVKFLKSMFNVLELRAGISINPWSRLKTKQKMAGEGRRNLTQEELQTILANATEDRRLIFSVGLFTGLRLADAVNLTWDAIDFEAGIATVTPRKTERFGKKVEVPLHADLLKLLAEHKARSTSNYLFPEDQAKHAKGPTDLTKQLQAFFESCGIQTNEKATHGHRQRAIVRVGFHSLRHSS